MSSEFNSMEDLAFSRSFRSWVLKKDSSEAEYWKNWVARNPDKAEMVKSAKALIYALHGHVALLSEEDIGEEVRKAVARLREAPRYIPLDGLEGRPGRWSGMKRVRRLWAAAALAAAVALAGFFLYRFHGQREALPAFLSSHRLEVLDEKVAGDAEEKTFDLPDQSLVRLGKNGRLYFPKDQAAFSSRREVYLEGDAIFDVRKNVAIPFFVFSEHVIIKALGTSFIVHSLPADSRTGVTVLTGKVVVYGREDYYSAPLAGHQPGGLVLTPNQEGIYDRAADRWLRTLVGSPEPLKEAPDSLLSFRDAPLREVVQRLHELYGVNFQYDEEEAGRCRLTIQLGNEPFFDHVRRICMAINGSYESIDGNIVLTLRGSQ